MSAGSNGPKVGSARGPEGTNGNGHSHSSRKAGPGSTTPWVDQLPPHNLEAEQGVLGSILLDNDILHDIAGILKPEDFYRDAHQVLYQAIRDLYDQGRAVDGITLADELVRRGHFERIGGDTLLTEVIGSVPHAANGKYYAAIVREKAVTRVLIQSANQIIQDGYSAQFRASELLESAEKRIYSIAEEQISGETVDIRDILGLALDRISARAEANQPISGIPTRFPDLDHLTCGFQGSQLVILAARPSMGKTAFALNICEHAVADMNPLKPVLLVSLEMGRNEIAERMLCSRGRVDGHKIRTGQKLVQMELVTLGRVLNDLRHAPMFIDDTPTRNMLQITANARRLKMRHDIGLIVVDYIQLIEPNAEEARDSRQEQIAKISRRLKTLARELEVPVIALSQLNRAVETREDRRPRMADLRESGAIEQDADIVLLLHRPEYYDPSDQPGIAEAIVAKNRNGATGTVKLTFLKNFMRFESLAVADVPLDAATF